MKAIPLKLPETTILEVKEGSDALEGLAQRSRAASRFSSAASRVGLRAAGQPSSASGASGRGNIFAAAIQLERLAALANCGKSFGVDS